MLKAVHMQKIMYRTDDKTHELSYKRNFGLDFVRFFAIVPVLIVHYVTFALKDVSNLVYVFGDFGVEIFFALSGFLIGGIILRDFANGFSLSVCRIFYVRRWMRTLPLYYVFFVASAYITIYGFTLDHVWSAWCLAYLVFMQNLAWPMLAAWYHESWSLAIEEWFYLLFPLLFFLLAGFKSRTRVLLIAIAMILVPLILRIVVYAPDGDLDETVRKIVVLRLDSIAFGILAIVVATRYPRELVYWKNLFGVVGACGIVIATRILQGQIDVGFFFLHTFSFTLISASFALIVIWAYFTEWRAWEADSTALIIRWFSTRSYALYLCHGSVLRTMIARGWFAKTPVVSAMIFFGSSLLLAELAHRIIERPFMRMRPKELRDHRPAQPAIAT